jgi:hypothetical protein
MKKKIFIIVGIFILLLLGTLFAAPYLFKEQIKTKIVQSVNENIDATISFDKVDLSFLKNFPKASITIEKLLIINKAPFAGDTLVAIGELNLKLSIAELFNGDKEPMNIEGISSHNGIINIIFNKNGVANYDIALKDSKKSSDATSKPLLLKIQEYKIENFKFQYTDESSTTNMTIDSLNHEGTGDFASEQLDLDTKSTAKISLSIDNVKYMKNISINLDAVLGIDLKNSKYTFKQNKFLINQMPLELDGFIQMVASGQEYDLRFKTPTSSFKNFLGIVPAAYATNVANVKTTGDFTVEGFAKGLYSNTTVPKFTIKIASHNASFQHPDLPKSVRNISIDTKIINQTGILNDTYVNLDKLSFAIDQDVFNAKATIRNITVNPLIDAAMKGTVNLGNVSKAYPIQLSTPLSGILKADITTKFDMQSVEKSLYQNIYSAGKIDIIGFNYIDENSKKLTISKALVQFNPSNVQMKQMNATIGKSDISVSGTLENFYGFAFNNQELKGNFLMNSNQLSVDDFMTTKDASTTGSSKSEPSTTKKESEAVKIPSFLNCSVAATANTVLYDNLTLKNVSGKLIIKDEIVTLQNVKSSIFGGTIGTNGTVSTKGEVPVFKMDLNLNQVDIEQSFTQLDMLKKIAPLAGIINGKLNSTIKLNGNLDAKELTPDLKTIAGDLTGQLLSTTVNSSNSTLLTALGSNLKFIDMTKVNLNNIKAFIHLQDGKVAVKPFDIKYQDITATIGGTHGFDQSMNYNLKFDVPAKYLGAEANALLAKLSPVDAAKINYIPITAILGGNFRAPKITTDMKNAVTNFTAQLVRQQKEKLIGKGASLVSDFLQKNTSKSADTAKTATQKEAIKAKATDLLKGLFNKKKKEDTKPE